MQLTMPSRSYVAIPSLTSRLANMRALLLRFEQHVVTAGRLDQARAAELVEAVDKAESDVKAMAGLVGAK